MSKISKKNKKYFNTFVLNKFLRGEKISDKDIKFIASKINASDIYVKIEIRKVKNYLKKRILILKRNKKLSALAIVVDIPIQNLINLVLHKDLSLTKNGIERFNRILKELQGFKKYDASEKSQEESYTISDINAFIQLLNLRHKPDIDVVRSGKIKDGVEFYSNSEIYQALKKYWGAFGADIGTIIQAKKQMIALIDQFRDKGLLAKKINKGYFSNSFTVLNEKGRKIKKYGVFLKVAAE